jgi:hypothetical protein
MERQTEVHDPLAEKDPEAPESPATDIDPEDATPEEGVERPEPPQPDPEHVVEEKQRED